MRRQQPGRPDAGRTVRKLHWHPAAAGHRLQDVHHRLLAATTDLSVTVTSLTTVANATPVTGITIGLGFGTVSGSTCAAQIQAPAAPLNQELFAPNGASAGAYCVQIYDCPTGTASCTPTLAEAVNYSMTVKHY